MTVEMRSTGINIIGDTPWGTHISQFYQTKDDLIDMLVPYFKAGLENNEFCMWLTSEPLGVDDARKSLGKEVGNLDNYIAKGQIEILDSGEWYTKGGKFEPDMVSQNWARKETQASVLGFDGMRVSGNISWLQRDQRRAFAEYEADLEKEIGNYRMIALCSYPLDKCVPSDVLDVLKNHNFNISRYEGKWEIIETGQFRRKYLDAILSEGVGFFIILDNSLRMHYVSPSVKQFLGYAAEELLTGELRDHVHPDDLKTFDKIVTMVMRYPGRTLSGDLRIRRKNASWRIFEFNSQNLLFDPDIKGIVNSFFDVTERKQKRTD